MLAAKVREGCGMMYRWMETELPEQVPRYRGEKAREV